MSLKIPDSAKNILYSKIRDFIAEKRSIPLLIIGAATLAVTINIIELLCTAGLPAAYTRILVEQNLSLQGYYSYLILYVIFYMLDELLLLIGFVLTLTAFRFGEKYGRISRLVGGLVMISLGSIMIIRPELLLFG